MKKIIFKTLVLSSLTLIASAQASTITSAELNSAVKNNSEIKKIISVIKTSRKLPCKLSGDSATLIPSADPANESDTFTATVSCSQPGNVQTMNIDGLAYQTTDKHGVVHTKVLMSHLSIVGAE